MRTKVVLLTGFPGIGKLARPLAESAYTGGIEQDEPGFGKPVVCAAENNVAFRRMSGQATSSDKQSPRQAKMNLTIRNNSGQIHALVDDRAGACTCSKLASWFEKQSVRVGSRAATRLATWPFKAAFGRNQRRFGGTPHPTGRAQPLAGPENFSANMCYVLTKRSKTTCTAESGRTRKNELRAFYEKTL